ncbi:hypothetical protein ES703_16148 [subsurface metagenome]
METTLGKKKLLWWDNLTVKLQDVLIRDCLIPFAVDKQLGERPQPLKGSRQPKLGPKFQALFPVDVQSISAEPHPEHRYCSLELPHPRKRAMTGIFEDEAPYLRRLMVKGEKESLRAAAGLRGTGKRN